MTRAALSPLVALAGLAALSGCGKSKPAPPGAGFGHPSSIAVFRGVAGEDPAVQPYLAVANEARNDVTLVNANTGAVVLAPIQLRSLAIPVASRPTILVSASLGDDGADLLVAVAGDATSSSGGSSLQLVRTWDAASQVVDAQTVTVTGEVVAAVAVPNPAGTTGKARIALALSDRRIVLVDYQRSGAEVVASATSQPLALAVQPVALAASDDGTRVYAATLDEFTPGAADYGVAEIDVSSGAPAFVRRIDTRGPTRLVAAATLRERLPGSFATDKSAFSDTAPAARRLYAVLDESGCGVSGRIDCGVAVVDLDLATPALRADVSGRMPYLAPIPLPSRPLAIAVSPPPATPPDGYETNLMRLWPATGALATTAVAAVPCEDGNVYFLDLARWKVANEVNAVVGTTATVTLATPTAVEGGTVRLTLAKPGGTGTDVLTADADAATATPAYVQITPGYTRSDAYHVSYQGALPSLSARRAEVGGGQPPWLAMQVTAGTSVGQVVRLWDPTLGVKPGDTVQIQAAGVPGCAGTTAPGAAAGTTMVFEARVDALLQPSAAYPGGAVQLGRKLAADVPLPLPSGIATASQVVDLWGACFDSLAAGAGTVPNLTASVLAGGYVVTNDAEHLGRPDTAGQFALEYPAAGEDAATGCTIVPWPATLSATACDATTCRPACDALLAARRARRVHHLAENCGGDGACQTRFAGIAFPDVAGPVVKFQIALDPATGQPVRGLGLTVKTTGGVQPFYGPPAGTASIGSKTHPEGVATFDRSPKDKNAGYRFLVPYAGDWVLDTSPSLQSAASSVIR